MLFNYNNKNSFFPRKEQFAKVSRNYLFKGKRSAKNMRSSKKKLLCQIKK